MLGYLLDTDHLTLYLHGHPSLTRRLTSHTGAVGISVVTVEEILRGRLAQIARAGEGPTRIFTYGLLVQALQLFAEFRVVAYDQPAENEFQQLRSIRIGTRDRKIGSIALAQQLTLVTRNRRDFARVPGLPLEDWSV